MAQSQLAPPKTGTSVNDGGLERTDPNVVASRPHLRQNVHPVDLLEESWSYQPPVQVAEVLDSIHDRSYVLPPIRHELTRMFHNEP